MSDIVIIGVGGNAFDIVDMIGEINTIKDEYNILGFLDDSETFTAQKVYGYPVIGKLSKAKELTSQVKFIFAIGSERTYKNRKNIFEKLSIPKDRFPNIIHPTANISKSVNLGYGNIIFPNTIIHSNVVIDNFNIFLAGNIINHNCVFGSFNTCASANVFAGGVIVKNNCFIGLGSSVRNNVTIENNTLIGMGSNVLENTNEDSVLYGNPAKEKRYN